MPMCKVKSVLVFSAAENLIALPSCPSKFPSRIRANTDAPIQLLWILNESPIVSI